MVTVLCKIKLAQIHALDDHLSSLVHYPLAQQNSEVHITSDTDIPSSLLRT